MSYLNRANGYEPTGTVNSEPAGRYAGRGETPRPLAEIGLHLGFLAQATRTMQIDEQAHGWTIRDVITGWHMRYLGEIEFEPAPECPTCLESGGCGPHEPAHIHDQCNLPVEECPHVYLHLNLIRTYLGLPKWEIASPESEIAP